MESSLGVRARLLGFGFLMAFAAACGGGGGGSADGGTGPGDPPAPAPAPAPPEIRGWANPFGSAAVVLGQAGFDQVDPQGTSATPIPNPLGSPAVSADGRLFIANSTRLLGFDDFESTDGPIADLDIELAPGGLVSGVSIAGSMLVVPVNHQVLIFKSGNLAGPPDVVAGGGSPNCSASELRQPRSAFLTRLGQLIVADSFNNRVLIWNTVPDIPQLGAPDVVLGQRSVDRCQPNDDNGDGTTAATARTMSMPSSVWSDGVRLVVADSDNHRILVWDSFPTAGDTNSHRADHVLGQANPTSIAPNRGSLLPSGMSLDRPFSIDVSGEGELAVADLGNNRVLIWKAIPTTDGQLADFVVGQSDFVHRHSNDVEQKGVSGATPNAKTLNSPGGVRFHGRNLIVNDGGNNRVLVWREND